MLLPLYVINKKNQDSLVKAAKIAVITILLFRCCWYVEKHKETLFKYMKNLLLKTMWVVLSCYVVIFTLSGQEKIERESLEIGKRERAEYVIFANGSDCQAYRAGY